MLIRLCKQRDTVYRLLFNAAGGIVWATVFGLGGYLFGDSIHRIGGPLTIVTAGLGIIGMAAGIIILRRNERRLEDVAERALPGPFGVRPASPPELALDAAGTSIPRGPIQTTMARLEEIGPRDDVRRRDDGRLDGGASGVAEICLRQVVADLEARVGREANRWAPVHSHQIRPSYVPRASFTLWMKATSSGVGAPSISAYLLC